MNQAELNQIRAAWQQRAVDDYQQRGLGLTGALFGLGLGLGMAEPRGEQNSVLSEPDRRVVQDSIPWNGKPFLRPMKRRWWWPW